MGRHTQIWRGRIASSESQASPEQARGPLPPPPPPPGVKVSFAMSHVIYCWPLCPQYRSQSLLFWPTPNPKRVKDSQVVISHVPTQRPKDPKTYKLWLSATGTQTHTEREHTNLSDVSTDSNFHFISKLSLMLWLNIPSVYPPRLHRKASKT